VYEKGVSTVLRGYEYFKIFNKQVFYNKFAYIWSLAIPIVFLIFNSLNAEEAMTYGEFAYSTLFFWSYMILITASDGIGMGLLIMRDSNFLKMYAYISGSKLPIILGKVFSQLFFLWVNMVVFLSFSAIIHQQPILSLLFTSVLLLIPVALPIYFLFVIPATWRVRAASLGPMLTLSVILFVNVINIRLDTGTLIDYAIYLNPATVIVQFSEAIHSFILQMPIEMTWIPLGVLILYVIIGFSGYRKLDIISREAR